MLKPITIVATLTTKEGDYRRALEDYTKAIDLNPNYTNAYNNREVVQRELERLNESL